MPLLNVRKQIPILVGLIKQTKEGSLSSFHYEITKFSFQTERHKLSFIQCTYTFFQQEIKLSKGSTTASS